MADVAEELKGARKRVLPHWTREREHSLHERIMQGLVRRRRVRAGLALAAATLLVVGGLVSWSSSEGPGPVATVAPARAPRAALLELEDGSTVIATSANARVEPQEVARGSVAVRLTSGSARFSVAPNTGREFRVRARGVVITVIGTVFTVGLESGGVRVRVDSGRVHVAWPSGERLLAVGEEEVVRDVSALGPTEEAVAASPDTVRASNQAVGSEPSPAARANTAEVAADSATLLPGTGDSSLGSEPSWRALAQKREYARAYLRMVAEGPYAVQDEPGELLLAADVARLGGHPDKAVPRLERVLSRHARDSRAPLAAFTLGRTLLDQIGRPREAALAFAKVRRLDPGGTLSGDALAREVESWSRAGDVETARKRAEEYVSKYPNGQRLMAVKRFGSLD